MALLGPARRAVRLALAPSWSVVRAVCQARAVGWHGPPSAPSLPAGTVSRAASSWHPAAPLLQPCTAILIPARNYAKSKDKKGKGKAAKAHVSEEEMEEVLNVEQMMSHFATIVESLKQDYIKNLSLRSSAGSIETLPVQLEGDEYPLNEVAQVSRKSPQVVVISAAAFPQALPGIVAALRNAGMNLNPQQEGTSVIVPIPKVTKEHRESLAKGAKTMFNKAKDQLREAQNQYIRKARNKEGKFSDDLLFNVQLRIREIAEAHMQEAESMMQAKQKELLRTS